MSVNNDGIIVILSSPSGAGKTTLVKEISKKKNYKISISHTTRNPRANETNGKDYFFVNDNEFKNLIETEKFLEYAKVFNHYYGSSKKVVFDQLKKGNNVIFDIDWQGTQQIKNRKLSYKILTIFILPPSKEELYKRLLNRDKNNKEIANERMKQFNIDVLKWREYDHVVINDNLDNCYNEIIKFIENTDNQKKTNQKKLISMHVDNLLN
tara:strand:+ start:1136 stop:1765 length:630 start_codon:yes stop_codon:yes gene_type:complete